MPASNFYQRFTPGKNLTGARAAASVFTPRTLRPKSELDTDYLGGRLRDILIDVYGRELNLADPVDRQAMRDFLAAATQAAADAAWQDAIMRELSFADFIRHPDYRPGDLYARSPVAPDAYIDGQEPKIWSISPTKGSIQVKQWEKFAALDEGMILEPDGAAAIRATALGMVDGFLAQIRADITATLTNTTTSDVTAGTDAAALGAALAACHGVGYGLEHIVCSPADAVALGTTANQAGLGLSISVLPSLTAGTWFALPEASYGRAIVATMNQPIAPIVCSVARSRGVEILRMELDIGAAVAGTIVKVASA